MGEGGVGGAEEEPLPRELRARGLVKVLGVGVGRAEAPAAAEADLEGLPGARDDGAPEADRVPHPRREQPLAAHDALAPVRGGLVAVDARPVAVPLGLPARDRGRRDPGRRDGGGRGGRGPRRPRDGLGRRGRRGRELARAAVAAPAPVGRRAERRRGRRRRGDGRRVERQQREHRTRERGHGACEWPPVPPSRF
ncbi:hypothetical protein EG871_14355 [Enterococcus faecium]|nr:hypothetical protein EG871_14355 [Enterococcus faecium]